MDAVQQRTEAAGKMRATVWGPTFLVLAGALGVFGACLCVNAVPVNDLFWQLRAGREIVATHTVPHSDTYSWTRFGTPWVVPEWLSFALFWQAFHLAGYGGVWLLEVFLIVLSWLLLFTFLAREIPQSPLIAFLLAAFAAVVSCGFFQPRPHLFTFLFLTLTLGSVQEVRRCPAQRKRLWLLVPLPLFVLWANLHGGVLVGVSVLALFGLGALWEGKRREARSLLGIAACCGAATLVTPYGWHVYGDLFATVTNTTAMDTVNEWASPDFHTGFGHCLFGLILLLIFGLVGTRERRGIAETVLIIALIGAALTARRNVPLLALCGILVGARHIASALQAALERLQSQPLSLFGPSPPRLLVCLAALLLPFASLTRAASLMKGHGHSLASLAGVSFALETFPGSACRFLEKERFPTTMRLYNDYGDGGFLIWRVPQYPVFIDGRADVYFGPVLEDAAKMHRMPCDWGRILAKYHPDAALISASASQAPLFLSAPDWALVYADSTDWGLASPHANTLIFIRRCPQFGALIARCRRNCPALHR